MLRWSYTHTITVLIAATALAGCPQVLPDPQPVANFSATPRSGNTGLEVAFSNQSTSGSGGPITSWQWEFGDGGRSSEPNPRHTYFAAGTYDVSLTVTSSGGSHTRTRRGFIEVSSTGAAVELDETGGTVGAKGVRITAAEGALEGRVRFGITRVNEEIPFNVFEPINRVGDTFRITHDSARTDMTGSSSENPLVPLEIAIPYFEDVVPTGSRTSANVHILAQLEDGLVVPILGEIRSGVVVGIVTGLPASAEYTVVFRPDALVETLATSPAAKAATSVNWNASWRASLSPALLNQLTALRLGTVQRASSFDNRNFTESQRDATVAALESGLAALQGDFEAVRGRSPRLVTMNGAYNLVFFNSVQRYPTSIGSIDNVFFAGSPFGSVVVDPRQLLAVSTWNADRFAADPGQIDIAFKLSANRAIAEEVTRAVVSGYDYPVLEAETLVDGREVPFDAGISEGLALFAGQMYGGMAGSRAQLPGDFALLSTPLLAPFDASVSGYAASGQEFFRYVDQRYTPEQPLEYVARGTGAVKGLLEELRTALDSATFLTFEDALALAARALDDAFFAHLGIPLGEAYRDYALDLAFEHGPGSVLRPSDAGRLPLVMDETRFSTGAFVSGTLDGPDAGLDFDEALANIPPLTSRAVKISVDPAAEVLTLNFNRDNWLVDDRNQSVVVMVYREGLPGVMLPQNESQLVFSGFEADRDRPTADFFVLIVNSSVTTANSVTVSAISTSMPASS